MSRKKVFLLLVSFVFMMSLFANFVSAAQDTFMPEIIEKFAKFLFLDLSGYAKSAPDTFVIYSKFLFFILVFSILFWGTQKVFKDNKNIAGTVAFLFAVITIVMIPKEMMIFIFESYSIVISFFFGLLPFIVGFIIAHRALPGDETWKKILRAIIYIAIAVFTFAFVQTLRGLGNPLYIELAKWAEVGGFIALIVGIFALIGSIGGGAGGGGGGAGGGEHWWDRATGWLPRRDDGGGGVRTAEQEARIVRQMTETVTRMETNYAIMRGVANGAGVSLNNAITFAQRRAGGLVPGATALAPGPAAAGLGFTPTQVSYLNNPARLGRLQDAYEQWTTDWNRLYTNITNIARLNASLRARVIAQLSNPI